MGESKITPMLRNSRGDDVSAAISDADWFRVEIKGLWLGDFGSFQEAEHAFGSVHHGEFPMGMSHEYAARITEALRG